MKRNDIICWWSGGVTSAVACKLAIDIYGIDRCLFIFLGTDNEDSDTYRFKKDCEQWYGKSISTLSRIGKDYASIREVWMKYLSLNVATGAICSSELKREVREEWERANTWTHQVFGFDISEPKRALAMSMNHRHTKPIFPLLMYGFRKEDCISMLQGNGIDPPDAYKLGFHNNNCLQTGCVQGSIGYWQKMQRDFPEKFDAMASMEHELTDKKGSPVTMLKDQGKNKGLVFLKPHPDFPNIKDISMMKGREPKPLMECNGFCGTNDLLKSRSETEEEINFSVS